MNILDLCDRIDANEYRSDRFPAVPFTTFEDVLKFGQAVMDLSDKEHEWAGVVTPSCTSHTPFLTVSREVGVGLRVGGEASLCFDCGPDGGHYHPSDGQTMESVATVAAALLRIVEDR